MRDILVAFQSAEVGRPLERRYSGVGRVIPSAHKCRVRPTCFAPDWCGLAWTDFTPLPVTVGRRSLVPKDAGVYRVRIAGQPRLAYIGQTGRNLRERVGALGSGLLAVEMPFNDPHTACPKLWSYRAADGLEYEVSAAASDLPAHDRMALENFLLWNYRLEVGGSTLCNFGRLHPRYTTSKNRSTGLRGGKLDPAAPDNPFGPSVPPLLLRGTSGTSDWMGLAWSPTRPLEGAELRGVGRGPGVYRLSDPDSGIVYIGETQNLAGRLRSHARHDWGVKPVFSFAELPDGYTPTQLLEVENDLIGGFFAEYRRAPRFQFGERTESAADR